MGWDGMGEKRENKWQSSSDSKVKIILNLLQATASYNFLAYIATRFTFGDWEKNKNLLVYTP
ncbi:Protein of unknown function [Bacillus mycoides]|nr:Protein of unknown function [Bacillus mycoides]